MKDLGQLFITGVSGAELTEDEKDIIQDMDLGGIILFSRNYENPVQLARLVNSIQELRNELPMFIGVDQEGGRVLRFKEPFIQLPSPKVMASFNSAKFVYNAYRTLAHELKACGVNLNFAPCVDILKNEENTVIGDRSFGDSMETVEKFASAALRGLQTERILGCVKHFPGHGRSKEDSHDELPKMDTSLEELQKEEFSVFRKMVRSKLDFMMIGHLMAPEIDAEMPTSLSENAYKLIRNSLKFTRVIVTDDMQMKAITDNYSTEEAAEKAFEAGADILMYKDLEVAFEAYKAIEKKILTRDLTPQFMKNKISRVYKCKEARFKNYKPVNAVTVTSSFGGRYAQQVLDNFTKPSG